MSVTDEAGLHGDAQVHATLTAATGALGFDYFAAIVWLPRPAALPVAHLVTNLDRNWLALYRERGYATMDPVTRWCKNSDVPLVWSDALYASAPALRKAALSVGLRHGWSQAVRDGLGVRGMLTLARTERPLDGAELRRNKLAMHLLAHHAHRLLLTKLRQQSVAALSPSLTARELDVLRWAGDGKTAQDTADILGLRLTTVRSHIRHAVHKLDAPNINAAVFRALYLGLLHTPDAGGSASLPRFGDAALRRED